MPAVTHRARHGRGGEQAGQLLGSTALGQHKLHRAGPGTARCDFWKQRQGERKRSLRADPSTRERAEVSPGNAGGMLGSVVTTVYYHIAHCAAHALHSFANPCCDSKTWHHKLSLPTPGSERELRPQADAARAGSAVPYHETTSVPAHL